MLPTLKLRLLELQTLQVMHIQLHFVVECKIPPGFSVALVRNVFTVVAESKMIDQSLCQTFIPKYPLIKVENTRVLLRE